MISKRLINIRLPFSSRFGFSSDYYQILGVSTNASQEEIRQAYYKQAQGFYPDVAMTTEEVSVEKGLAFQKIAEAYAVLSILESRNSYDLMNKKQPNLLFGKDRQAFLDAQQRQEDGNKIRAGVQAGSYAEERKNWLAKERKRFNVDEIGRYRGGLPQERRGTRRGESIGVIGELHDPLIHGDKIDPLRYEHRIDSQTVQEFKVWQQHQKAGRQWQYYGQVAEVDYDYFKFEGVKASFKASRNFFLVLIALPWLLLTYSRRQNRSLAQDIFELKEAGEQFEGKLVDGLQVVLGKTGTLKLQEPVHQHHH